MRSTLLSALVIVFGVAALAQAAPGPKAVLNPPLGVGDGIGPHAAAPHCCREKVWDKAGKEVGDLLTYDQRYGPQQMIGFMAYRVAGGDAVTLQVTPELINGLQSPGGSTALFTTPDCSGNDMFAAMAWPPLAKRYAMVLLSGGSGSLMTSATSAWLWVTAPLPPRVIPGAGTVFHSQWNESGACSPYPAPGYTVTSWPGGFWMKRVEDLFVKFRRPFYVDY